MNPIVAHKTSQAKGNHIPFTTANCSISFNDELTLNLIHYQRDEDVHLSIVRDRLNMLVIGGMGETGGRFVAEIFIPARQFEEFLPEERAEVFTRLGINESDIMLETIMNRELSGLETGAGMDRPDSSELEELQLESAELLPEPMEIESIVRIAVPLNLGQVTLTLWEVE